MEDTRSIPDESIPLLRYERSRKSLKSTPLPWLQFSALFLLQQAGYLAFNTTYPFMPELVRNVEITYYDKRNVGFYVGMLQSAYYLAAAVTVFHCCRLSDLIGRKPVILAGVLGLSISMCAFGFSTKFSALLMCQFLLGALNGTTGAIQSTLMEITDPTNIARVRSNTIRRISFDSLTRAGLGLPEYFVLGSAIGGSLSRPADQLPQLFGSSGFLRKYPYFLPCAVCSTLLFISWVIGFAMLKETVNQPIPLSSLFKYEVLQDAHPSPLSSAREVEGNAENDDLPLTLRAMLTPKVVMAAINSSALSLVDIAFWAGQPVFLSTPIQDGGLGFKPPAIGTITSIYAILAGLCQMFIFPSVHGRLGSKTVFMLGVSAAFPTFGLWPAMNWMAKRDYIVSTCFALILQIFFSILTQFAFGAITIIIAESPPNRGSLGATVGFCQMTSNIVRAVGPAVFNSLFSLSIGSEYLGGQLVYFILILIAGIALCMAFLLPRDGDQDSDHQDIGR